MNDTLTMILAGAAGLCFGAIFFGGLWWTVRQGVSSPRPALWFLVSWLLRMGVVLAGFYFVGGGQWQRMLSCLLGFVAARFVVLWLTRPATDSHPASAKEASHAS